MSPTESRDDIHFSFEFLAGQLNCLQHLHLSLCIETISRFDLYGCGAAFAHLSYILFQMLDKRIQGSFIDLLGSVPNPKSFVVYVHISKSVELHIVFFGPIPSEKCVRVGIDQPRKDNQVRAILLLLKSNVLLLDPLGDLVRGGDFSDDTFAVNSYGEVGLGLNGAGLFESEVM